MDFDVEHIFTTEIMQLVVVVYVTDVKTLCKVTHKSKYVEASLVIYGFGNESEIAV